MSSRLRAGAEARARNWVTLRTRARSCAASRPQENACLFISIAAPLISMARRIASSESGMAPFWNAKPSMKALVAMLSPIKADAMPVASMISSFSSLIASRSAPCIAFISKSMSGFITKLAVGCKSALTIAWVTPRSARLRAACLRKPPCRSREDNRATGSDPNRVAISSGVRRSGRGAHDRAVLLRKAG